MFTKYVLPLLAVLGLSFAVYTVVQGQKVAPTSKPVIPPPSRPEGPPTIAGAGIIEANLENIPIGANIPGVVTELFVKVHDAVKIGTPLFRTDDRNLQAELIVRQANMDAAKAQFERIKAAPQAQQDIPTAQAAVEEARARFREAEVVSTRTSNLFGRGVATASDYDRDRHALDAAKASLARAEADLKRIQITWEKDIEVSRAQVEQMQSMVKSTRIEIERCTVKALAAGEVLQVNVRPGQYAASVWKEPLIVLGDVNTLNVRVDIDEQDVPYFDERGDAFATLKGRPGFVFALTKVVKVEPYVIPKKSLTGDNSERVDTRVLQVVYALPQERDIPLYVGQQMDVYLRAAKLSDDQKKKLSAGPGVTRPFEENPASISPTTSGPKSVESSAGK
ncbi:MAG: multidrug resistance efflux pump [Planctomycetota bacterium]|nr:multidrug resistance efflux pump [Planctomycetota bacterium]